MKIHIGFDLLESKPLVSYDLMSNRGNGYLIGAYLLEENVLVFIRDDLPALLEHVDLATRQRLWIQLDGGTTLLFCSQLFERPIQR